MTFSKSIISIFLIFLIERYVSADPGVRIRNYESFLQDNLSGAVKSLMLDDVLKNIKREGFLVESDVTPNNTCSGQMMLYMEGLIRGEIWALRMLDASSKLQSGILSGNIINLGMFDECMAVETTFQDVKIRGRHCMASFGFKNFPPIFAPTFSFCLPAVCDNESLAYMLNITMQNPPIRNIGVTLDSTSCARVEPEEWTPGAIVVLIGFIIVMTAIVICTIIDLINIHVIRSSRFEKLHDFSLITNASRVLSFNVSSNTLPAFHGIRVLSICWILLGHEYLTEIAAPIINLFDVADWVTSWTSLHVVLAIYAVDTFFMISGFLVAYFFVIQFSDRRKFNVFSFYLHRYIRLTPVLIAVMLFSMFLLPKMGSGPRWDIGLDMFNAKCYDNWWTLLLYIQNFVDPKNMCLGHTWYLAVDMQLFSFSPLILLPLVKKPKLGYIICGVCLITSVIIPALIIGIGGYPTIMTENGTTIENMMGSFDQVYIKPYTRASPYIIGIIFGYITAVRKIQIRRNFRILGWITAILGFIYVSLTYKVFLSKTYSYDAGLEAFFTPTSRAAWGFSVAWIIYESIHGYGGPISKLLSHPVFLPLSRITYCFYLLHIVLQTAIYSAARTPIYFSTFNHFFNGLAVFMITAIVSFIFALLFESPFIALEKMLHRRQKSESNDTRGLIGNHDDVEDNTDDTENHE